MESSEHLSRTMASLIQILVELMFARPNWKQLTRMII